MSVPYSVLQQYVTVGRRTKDDDCGCGAASFCHYVAGQTCVVAGVGQTGLVDDEVLVSPGVNIVISHGTY